MTQINTFTTENLPYVYQSEYYSLAWVHEHYGFYIDPTGAKYHYKQPEDWRFYTVQPYEEQPPAKAVWGYETTGEIKPEDLFHNMSNATRKSNLFSFLKRNYVTDEMMASLMKSKVTGRRGDKTDSGTRSNALLIYDSDSNLYRRILLSASGEMEMLNTNRHTESLLNRMGQVYFRH